jgi:hypothetical protein
MHPRPTRGQESPKSGRAKSRGIMITVKFANGDEKRFNRDAAGLSGPVFLLYRRRGRKLETSDVFSADQIVWARLPTGEVVSGKGKMKPKPRAGGKL